MNCDCNERCFIFIHHLIEGDNLNKYKILKCDRLQKENSKKKPCNYYKKQLISSYPYTIDKPVIENNLTTKNIDYRSKLNEYIHFCEKIEENENYYSNIVYLLNILNYKFVFNEKISDLKNRLSDLPDKVINNKSVLPIKFVDVPENLKPNKTKQTRRKSNSLHFVSTRLTIRSDSESDSDDSSDGGFDIDYLDSDVENDDYEEDYLSD